MGYTVWGLGFESVSGLRISDVASNFKLEKSFEGPTDVNLEQA